MSQNVVKLISSLKRGPISRAILRAVDTTPSYFFPTPRHTMLRIWRSAPLVVYSSVGQRRTVLPPSLFEVRGTSATSDNSARAQPGPFDPVQPPVSERRAPIQPLLGLFASRYRRPGFGPCGRQSRSPYPHALARRRRSNYHSNVVSQVTAALSR
jgi:hypothetical protein